MASPASFNHEDVVSLVFASLRIFVDSKRLGKVMGSFFAYELSVDNVYQPDISFIRAARLHMAGDVHFPGPPDIAVEVVSPSSRQYDTVEKKLNYARFGVGEYWLIDPVEERAVFYRQVEGHLLPIPAEEGVVRSQLLEGYWLRREWLFPPDNTERPSVLEIAREQGVV